MKNVAPRITVKTVVVGKGLEGLKPKLKITADVEIVGAVQSLAAWYLGAHCVIAPIFDGSGMKTKVAEGLMFGKKVIGTREAFSGYEDVAHKAGWICATADEFVEAINRVGDIELPRFNSQVREIFDQTYSYSAARARLARVLEPLVKRDCSIESRWSGFSNRGEK